MKSIKEVEEFNKANNTKYSYGQYFALKKNKKTTSNNNCYS